MKDRSRINSFFYDVTERISDSTMSIAFDKKDNVDPSLIKRFLGKEMSSEERHAFQKIVKALPDKKFLEISLT